MNNVWAFQGSEDSYCGHPVTWCLLKEQSVPSSWSPEASGNYKCEITEFNYLIYPQFIPLSASCHSYHQHSVYCHVCKVQNIRSTSIKMSQSFLNYRHQTESWLNNLCGEHLLYSTKVWPTELCNKVILALPVNKITVFVCLFVCLLN
jgi:hypothetical protein